jgi:hypothetical protein
MKRIFIALAMLCISLPALADCVDDLWGAPEIAQCVAHEWSWDQQQEQALADRITAGQVEIEVFEVINAHCDIKLTVYDPLVIEKQQYFQCITQDD